MGIIQRQSFANALIIYSGIAIGFVNMYLQPICLDPDTFGLTRVLLSFSGLVSSIMPLGAGNIMIRFFQNYIGQVDNKNRFVSFVFSFGVLGFLLIAGILLVNYQWIIDSYAKQSLLFSNNFWLVFPMSFFMVGISLANAYSFALSKSVVPSFFSEFLIRVLLMVLVGLFYYNFISIQTFILGFVGSYGLNFLGMTSYVFYINRPTFRFDFQILGKTEIRTMIGFGLLISLATMASIGLKNLDTVLLAKYVNLKMAGIYSIALFMGLFIETPLNSLDRIASTKMAIALAQKDQKEIQEIYHKSSSNLFWIGGLLFIGVNTCISPLLTYLPEAYRGNELVILIISLGSLVNMASGSNTSIIYNSEHYIKGTFLLATMFILLFVLLWLFIPLYGIIGSAIAIASTTTLFNLSKMAFIKHYFKMQPFGLDSLKLGILIMGMLTCGLLLPHLPSPLLDLLYRGTVVSVGFLFLSYLFHLIPQELLEMTRKFLRFS
jgi:O-antigen/teichoic acid export membrane protein